MMYDELITTYNYEKAGLNVKHSLTPENLNFNTKFETPGLNMFFNQESPYKYPPLIICDDSKRTEQSIDVYKNYMDVITDDCGNRFNIRNLDSCGYGLQAGYSANIDLDSHLKNINYYNDRCYYDNWKLPPNSIMSACNGLKRNATILTPDYTPVGRNYADCIGNCSNVVPCWNTAPTDINCEVNIRNRYNFNNNNNNNKFQGETCIQPGEWKKFQQVDPSLAVDTSPMPNGNRNQNLIDSLNRGEQHEFYQLSGNISLPDTQSPGIPSPSIPYTNNQTIDYNYKTPCVIYPPQRLFNNITKRSMLPNQHFKNIEPKYMA